MKKNGFVIEDLKWQFREFIENLMEFEGIYGAFRLNLLMFKGTLENLEEISQIPVGCP